MVDSATIVIQAGKFGYDHYGPKGAVAASIAVGGSYVFIKKAIPRYTNLDEERVDEIYDKVSDDEKLAEILGEEFTKRFGDYFDGAAGTQTID